MAWIEHVIWILLGALTVGWLIAGTLEILDDAD